jgi:hypothetical protein
MFDVSSVYKKQPDFVNRKIAGEMILVPIRHNVGDLACIYNLNEVGSRIWELIDEKTTAGQIRDKIVEEYEITAGEAEADLAEFLNILIHINAVSPVASKEDIKATAA